MLIAHAQQKPVPKPAWDNNNYILYITGYYSTYYSTYTHTAFIQDQEQATRACYSTNELALQHK